MALMTGAEYVESLKEFKPIVYALGEKVDNVVDHPSLQPFINVSAMTYELVNLPEFGEIITVESNLNGEKINRFTHIHNCKEDLLKKIKMIRLLSQRTGMCVQRCIGLEALNALYITTFNIDRKYGTEYHERLKNYIEYIQKRDLMIAGSILDVQEGDNSSSNTSKEMDLSVRVQERGLEGIIVYGAKSHVIGAINSHEIIVLPMKAETENDKDCAIAFAVPIDQENVKIFFGGKIRNVGSLANNVDFESEGVGIGESLVIFDNVFVPWERVFMCGEFDFILELVETFLSLYKCIYGCCKVGIVDVLIGASKWIIGSSGMSDSSYLGYQMAKISQFGETCWGCAFTCCSESFETSAGAFAVDFLLSDVVKLNAKRLIYECGRFLEDVAIEANTTFFPSEENFNNDDIKKYVKKFFLQENTIKIGEKEKMYKLLRSIIGNLRFSPTLQELDVFTTQKLMSLNTTNIERKKELAGILAGIKSEKILL